MSLSLVSFLTIQRGKPAPPQQDHLDRKVTTSWDIESFKGSDIIVSYSSLYCQ